jgi:hypothetical protein
MKSRAADAGQATLEYMLMLLTAVLMFMLVYNTFLKPLATKFRNYLTNRFDQVLTKGDLHTLPFKAPAN